MVNAICGVRLAKIPACAIGAVGAEAHRRFPDVGKALARGLDPAHGTLQKPLISFGFGADAGELRRVGRAREPRDQLRLVPGGAVKLRDPAFDEQSTFPVEQIFQRVGRAGAVKQHCRPFP